MSTYGRADPFGLHRRMPRLLSLPLDQQKTGQEGT